MIEVNVDSKTALPQPTLPQPTNLTTRVWNSIRPAIVDDKVIHGRQLMERVEREHPTSPDHELFEALFKLFKDQFGVSIAPKADYTKDDINFLQQLAKREVVRKAKRLYQEIEANTLDAVTGISFKLFFNTEDGPLRQRLETYATNYAYFIPNETMVASMAKFIGNQTVLSVGCGKGLLEFLLYSQGVQIRATTEESGYNKDCQGTPFHEIEYMDATVAVKTYLTDILLLSWPPKKSPMAAEALKEFKGKHVIYIGESRGGTSADTDFFDLLDTSYRERTEISDTIRILKRFPTVLDRVFIFERK